MKGKKMTFSCRDVFMEKHWKSVIHRSICDYFFEAQSKVSFSSNFVPWNLKESVSCTFHFSWQTFCQHNWNLHISGTNEKLVCTWLCLFQAGSAEDVPPVITTPHHYLINIYRHSLYLVAVVMTEGKGKKMHTCIYLSGTVFTPVGLHAQVAGGGSVTFSGKSGGSDVSGKKFTPLFAPIWLRKSKKATWLSVNHTSWRFLFCSSSVICYRIPAPSYGHSGGLLWRVQWIRHKGKLCHCLRGECDSNALWFFQLLKNKKKNRPKVHLFLLLLLFYMCKFSFWMKCSTMASL